MRFVRFVVKQLDSSSGRRQGLFQAMAELRRSGQLTPAEEDTVAGAWSWFSEHLEKPTRLSLSGRPHAKAQALGWFKSDAVEHIQTMRIFADILGVHGTAVEMLRTDRPGYVVYEDDHQVAAYPFADTPS